MQMDQLISRSLIDNTDAVREINKPWPAQLIFPSCDVEAFALAEPCVERLLCRASDHLLIGTGIADHPPQCWDGCRFFGFRKNLGRGAHAVFRCHTGVYAYCNIHYTAVAIVE